MQSFIQDLACFNARRDSRAEAVLDWDAGIRYTWGDLQACAQKLAVFFTREQGLSKGDRVGFLCQNTVVMIASYYASLATGIVITAYNYRLNEQDLISIVEEESPSILFFTKESEEKASRLQKMCAASFSLVSVDEGCQVDAIPLSAIMEADLDEGFLPAEVSEEDPAMLAHTGGTTGRPKAAILSHRSIFLNAVSELVSMHVGDRDCAYVCMPFFHTGGWNVFTLPLLLAGGRIVLTREFSPELFFEIVEKEKPTVCMAADMMYQSLVKHPLFQESDLRCFRWVIGGASAISESSMRPFWDKGVRFFTGYGMTETGPNNFLPALSMTLEENRRKPSTVGKPMAFTQARIVDSQGLPVETGVLGEIVMKGGLSFSGYWNNEEETKAIMRDGWIHTGDVGYQDDDGDYYVCGRIKNMYISGGENIFPPEIERCLELYPGVHEACVLGVPDERWGEVGKALLVVDSAARFDVEGLREHLGERLSKIKHPRFFEIIEALPKNGAGKRDMRLICKKYGACPSEKCV